MSILKQELTKRNSCIFYLKNFANNNCRNMPIELIKSIDAIIEKGVLLIDEIDSMYWMDTEFVLDLTNYLHDSHRVVDTLQEYTGIPHINEVFPDLYIQTVLFFKYIEDHISNLNDVGKTNIRLSDFTFDIKQYN